MSPRRSTRSSSAGAYNVLHGIASAPILVIAANAITQSFPMGMCMPTRLALPTPAASNRFASCRDRRSRSAKVVVSSSVMTNGSIAEQLGGALQHHRHRRSVVELGPL